MSPDYIAEEPFQQRHKPNAKDRGETPGWGTGPKEESGRGKFVGSRPVGKAEYKNIARSMARENTVFGLGTMAASSRR